MSHNRLTGGLEPLSGCKELLGLDLYDNQVPYPYLPLDPNLGPNPTQPLTLALALALTLTLTRRTHALTLTVALARRAHAL